MHYDALDVATRRRLLEERRVRLQVEHYNHEINVQVAEAQRGLLGDEQADATIRNARAVQALVEQAHNVVVAELERL